MNGNLAQVIGCKQNSGRLHEWDEENRLRFVLGEKFTGYYGYNADGERVYKLTGQSILGQVNSGSIKAQAIFDDAVLYPNPYVVITTKGYTKHYYAGTERIATVIGGGGFGDMVSPTDNLSSPHDQDIIKTFYSYYQNYDPFFYQKIVSQQEKTEDIFGKPSSDLDYLCTPTELVMVDILNPPDILQKSIAINGQINYKEDEIYFYYGDHLGSANWITDTYGSPIQYIHYAPYGELIDNQVPYGYDERYKFTGKERDDETGYDFFGARYLSSILSHWLSVDPLSDKYPSISPYAYCAWNPIRFIDPDGKRVGIKGAYRNDDGTTTIETFYYGEVGGIRGFYHNGQRLNTGLAEYADRATDAIGKIHDGGKYGKMLVDAVVNDDRTIYLTPIAKPEQNVSLCDSEILKWSIKDYEAGSEFVPSFMTLSHEFGHFLTNWYKIADYGTWYMNGTTPVTNDEKLVVNFENLIRNENHLAPRKYYGFPSVPGGSGDGEIPQWDWVGNYLEILSNGL